ncbi:MAG: hypothetical protein U9Q30_06370, partial [Campylobacterota bacterium]|nr:hypothetical protein [Campylobacterota bacterium]
MASDLSQLIHEGLCSTINGLLAKTTTLKTITKIHEKDLIDLQILKINSTFEFTNIVSTWSYIIPAYTGSYIFNAMIGDDSEPVLEFDSDIADAMNEFVSNISGGLTTTINGSELKDLGTVKFTTSSDGIMKGSEFIDNENIYKFSLDLDGIDIDIFIIFDNLILPFIESIKQSEVSFYEEENIEEPQEEIKEIPKKQEEKEDISIKEEKQPQEDNKKEESFEDNKDDKLKKLIIVISGLILITIISGIVMYFLGMFEPEPIVRDHNKTKIIKTKDDISIVQYNYTPKVHFKVSDININRLNKRLKILTKHNILTNKEIIEQKKQEDERLYYLQKEKELEVFAKLNKEESLYPKDTNLKNTKVEEKTITQITPEIIHNLTKRFIVIDSLKYKYYKELIRKTNDKNARISICQNEIGKTLIYIGP